MADLRDISCLPGLKAREIRKTLHGEGVSSQGPIFYRVTIEQFCVDVRAAERQHGLEMLIGNAVIAAALTYPYMPSSPNGWCVAKFA